MDLSDQVAQELGGSLSPENLIDLARTALTAKDAVVNPTKEAIKTVASIINKLSDLWIAIENKIDNKDLYSRYNGKLDEIKLPENLIDDFKKYANINKTEFQILKKENENQNYRKILFKAKDREKVNEILKHIQQSREKSKGKSFRKEMKDLDKKAKEKQAEREEKAKNRNQDISR